MREMAVVTAMTVQDTMLTESETIAQRLKAFPINTSVCIMVYPVENFNRSAAFHKAAAAEF